MAGSADHKRKGLAAHDPFHEYEKLVSVWIDIFLDNQKAAIAQLPHTIDAPKPSARARTKSKSQTLKMAAQ